MEPVPVSIATIPPTPWQRRIALAMVAVMVLGAAAAFPHAREDWAQLPALLTIYQTSVVLADLLTATLLFLQFTQLRGTAIAILASGYLFSALIAIPHFLSFPGMLAPNGLIGGEQTTNYLWLAWHTVLPLLICVGSQLEWRGHHSVHPGTLILGLSLAALGLVALLVLLTTIFHDALPVLVVGHDFSRMDHFVWPMVLAVNATAMLCVALVGRGRSIMCLWLLVSTIALTLEIVSVWTADQRYDLGWYVSRIFSFLASTVLAVAFLVENGILLRVLNDTRRKLSAALDEAQAANEAKTRFFAAASHDLRQPFQAMRLYQAVLETKLTEECKPAMEMLSASMASAEGLLGEFLEMARLDAGALKIEPQPVDLAALVSRLCAETRPLAAGKGLILRHFLPPAHVTSDPTLLKRVLLNLLNNAVKYTPDGGILVGLRRRSGMVVVEVWDTGIGIAPAAQTSVFEEFYQVGNDSRDRAHGLGLGLAIVRRLCEVLGGSVTLSSRPGRGSVFRVCLPLTLPNRRA